MTIGQRLIERSIENGDVQQAMEGLDVLEWLGHGQRTSVRNKVRRVYDRAKELSELHNTPLSDPNVYKGYSGGYVIDHHARVQAERYLNKATT
jgi:hypothetical protein